MDVRATKGVSIMLSFELEADLRTLMVDGGFEEFAKQAHSKLEEELDLLHGLAAMKKIAEAAMKKPSEEQAK